MPKTKLGLIFPNNTIPKWLVNFIEKIQASNFAELSLLISVPYHKKNHESLSVKAYNKFDETFFIKEDALELQPSTTISEKYNIPLDMFSTFHHDYLSDIRKKLLSYDVQLLIYLIDECPPKELTDIVPHSIWTLQIGNTESSYPEGFLEVIEQFPIISSRIISTKKNTRLLISESFSAVDHFSVKRTVNPIYWKFVSMLFHSIRKLNHLQEQFYLDCIPFEKNSTVFENKISFFKLIKSLYKKYNQHKHNSKKSLGKWILMYNFEEEPSFSFKNFVKILPPKGKFWADPFVMFQDDLYYVFFEEAQVSKNFGHISMITIDENGVHSRPEIILKKPYHISYPFVFEFEGNYFMMPETASQNNIEVFKCVDFPSTWKYYKTILSKVKAVDPTLFQFDKKWWLFTSILENDGMFPSDEISLFYSDSPLSDEWIPHPQNPIATDVRKARSAGNLFKKQGKLFRPSQDSSRGYGYGIAVNEILTINEDKFAEKTIKNLIPDWNSAVSGIHTFNHINDLSIIDVKFNLPKHNNSSMLSKNI